MDDSEDGNDELKEYCGRSSARGETPGAVTTSIHVTALDGLVSANSLFTVAVFLGLSSSFAGQQSLQGKRACDAGADIARNLVVFEVVSFSFFLFSSLVAKGLKLAITVISSNDVHEASRARVHKGLLRFGLLASAVGSVMGCLFLLLSIVNIIQIRLGLLSCGIVASGRAVAALVTLVPTALVFYISTVYHAFTR